MRLFLEFQSSVIAAHDGPRARSRNGGLTACATPRVADQIGPDQLAKQRPGPAHDECLGKRLFSFVQAERSGRPGSVPHRNNRAGPGKVGEFILLCNWEPALRPSRSVELP
jgi:hypothetical protein